MADPQWILDAAEKNKRLGRIAGLRAAARKLRAVFSDGPTSRPMSATMPTDIRGRLKALVEEWRELPKHYMLRAHLTADQVAAILAESEPGCEVCAERARVAEESAQFHKDVEEGKRILAESESDQPRSAYDPQPPMSKSRLKRLIAQGALPLGHEFKLDVLGLYPDKCHELVARQLCVVARQLCGQPRSAHKPKDRA